MAQVINPEILLKTVLCSLNGPSDAHVARITNQQVYVRNFFTNFLPTRTNRFQIPQIQLYERL